MRIFMFLALLMPGAASPQDDNAKVEPVVLKDVLWQTLPDRVRKVFVGPDQRLWHSVGQGLGEIDRATARKVIEKEFTAESPCLPWLEPVLFEPGGRVWFVGRRRQLLLGYDGKDWIERTTRESFIGNCPGHGRSWLNAYNLCIAGAAFFHDIQGIHCFDGKVWTYKQWFDGPYNPDRRVSLYAELDGEGAVAVVPGKRPAVWRWRKGEWQAIRTDFDFQGRAVPSPENGLWIFREKGRMESIGFNEKNEIGEDLIVQIVKAKDPDARKQAADALVRCGAGVRPKIERALATTYDPDALEALTGAMERLTKPSEPITLGPYTAESVSLLHCDEVSARIFIAARGVRSKEEVLGSGMLIAGKSEGYRFFPGEEISEKWRTIYYHDSGPIASADGKFFLIRNRFLNAETGTFVAEIPEQRFVWIHALRNDGTAVVGTRSPEQSGAAIGVYRPNRPDDRRFLETTEANIARTCGGTFAVAQDGSIWANLDGKGLSRFAGDGWSVPPAHKQFKNARILRFTVGTSIVVSDNGKYALLTPEGATVYDTIEALIQSNLATIRSGGVKHMRSGYLEYICVAADAAGNVWLLKDERTLKILIGDRWVDGKTALLEAGSPDGRLCYLGPVGNGGKVFLTDYAPRHDNGRSFFGTAKDGNLVFKRSPHIMERDLTELGARDSRGGTWLPGTIGAASGSGDSITGQLAIRVTDDGDIRQFPDVGWAKLCDAKGNVWLGNIWQQPENLFNLWREGKIVRQIEIPSADDRTQLHADSDGSVYAWTDAGIHRLACVDPADPASFRIAEVYTARGIKGSRINIAASPLGYLVVSTSHLEHVQTNNYQYPLYLIRLPSSK